MEEFEIKYTKTNELDFAIVKLSAENYGSAYYLFLKLFGTLNIVHIKKQQVQPYVKLKL